jgi:hypothetical protein
MFRAVNGKAVAPKLAVWAPPPRCPEHPGALIIRDGFYAKSTPKKRQRYRCYPTGRGGSSHAFTPPLERE